MAKKPRPQVETARDDQGRIVGYYFRLQGRLWPLPGTPGSPEFVAEYQRLRKEAAATDAMGDARKRKRERLNAVVWTPPAIKLPPRPRGRPRKPDDAVYLLAKLSRDEATALLCVLRRVDCGDAFPHVEASPTFVSRFERASEKLRVSLRKQLGDVAILAEPWKDE
jgi:hypothetical protein